MTHLDKNMEVKTAKHDHYMWLDPRNKPFQLTGFPWMEEEQRYRRLPKAPDVDISPAVDRLADCTAGGQIHFKTDTQRLAVKVKLSDKANMGHMPATGQCGFDCYIGEPNKQRFAGVSHYDHILQHYEVTLFERDGDELIDVTLNFPLYQGVDEVWVGVDKMATIAPPTHKQPKRVIFYGTSITQGGCASRPGMAYTNILSRRFNMEFINLGFSGNGKGEAGMAHLISEIARPACLVLDYEANCVSTQLYKETLPRFINIYRTVHPDVPILVLSKLPYAREAYAKRFLYDRLERLHFQKELIEQMRKAGDRHIHFHEGTDLFDPHREECTVDGSHPNDLGFMHMADRLTQVLKGILDH